MPPTKAFGDTPAISFLAAGKAGLRQRRATFDLMASAWNGDPAIKLDRELFTSVHCFELEPLKAFQEAQGGRCEGLQASGIGHAAPWVTFDFDSTPEQALADAEKLVRHITSTFALDASDDVIRCNLSGSKGVHLRLLNPIFDPVDIQFEPDTFRRHKSFAMTLAAEAGVICDPAIYAVGNLIRLPNSRHPKTGRHAVPVNVGDLLTREHVAIIDPAATLWVDSSQPLRTQRFLWPTGMFSESFRTVFAERWAAAGQVAEQAVIEFVEKKTAFKPEGGSYVSFRMPFETQRILSGELMLSDYRKRKARLIGCECGERGFSLRGGWWLFREHFLSWGMDEAVAMEKFTSGWQKGRTNLFPGVDDETLITPPTR
jgi:hypothetical protein